MSTPTPQTSPTKSSIPSSASFNVLGFVPALVVQHFLKTLRQPRTLPESQHLRSVVMFADISGFTNLTESLSKIGTEGAEVIAFAINRYMELLVKGIGRSGGDIFKFAGDAMIVLWPPPDLSDGNQFEEEQLKVLMRQAIQSAMDIQDKLNNTNILDKIQLSVKIGFGIGDINIIYVGGVFSRCEYLATGDPLNQAFESEHHAKKGGETIVSREVFKLVGDYFDFEEIPEEDPHHVSENGPFYYVKDFKNKKVRMKADALIIKNNLTGTAFELIRPQIMSYIPAALLPYIEIDQEAWSAELRRLSILFVNLGIDLSDAKTAEGLKRIQKVIETVQKCVYYHQGSLNKLLMDDKGSTLIIVFGLPPFSHQDDPIRAILSGFALIRQLAVINCKCSIGIATGTVFAGVIGTSGSRREYSVLGDAVNLAARLMQLACGETTRKIICCETTAGGAQHKLIMKYYKMVKLKGKEKELPVFEPKMISSEEVKSMTKVEFFSDVKTHQNSLILNDAMMSDTQMMQRVVSKCFHMVGRQKEQQILEQTFDAFMRNQSPVSFTVIRGTYGIGKSLLIRVVLQRIKMDEHKYLKEDTLTVVVNSLGPMSNQLKANGFRQILQQVFLQVAKRRKRDPNIALLKELVPEGVVEDEHYETFKELVGIKLNEWIHNFPPPPNQQMPSAEKKLIEREAIGTLTRLLFKQMADESQPMPGRRGSGGSNTSMSQASDHEPIIILHPMVIVLEDLNLYDAISFHLIREVLRRFNRVLFIATVRDQYTEIQFMPKKTAQEEKDKKSVVTQDDVFSIGLQSIEDELEDTQFHTLDLKALNRGDGGQRDELRQLIKQQFTIDSFALDRDKGFQVPPPADDSMKFIEKKLKDHLIFQDNKQWLWKNVSDLFYQYIYLRTSGNPLSVMCLMQSMLRHKMITLSEKNPQVGTISEQCRQILDNEETIAIDAPQCWVQVNGPIIDKLACLESLLMKSASVIGDIFDIQTLNKIQPFKDQISSERLMKILSDMESQELLEVLDVSDFNIFYRFTHPFMREAIYQRMTYNQRRSLHRSVAEAIQTMTHPFEQEESRERKKLEFHWTQAEQKWSQAQSPNQFHNDRFSHKAKRSIIVKQIQQILSKANHEVSAIIRQGFLEKKSDKNVSWANRFVVMTSKELKYYYSENDFLTNQEPLGAVWLRNIFGLMPLNQRETGNKDWAFQLSASSWIKKRQEMPLRKFFFAALSEDQLEEWSIYLEFAKAKAIYDEFVANFGKISFPIGINQDNYDQSIRIDISSKPQKLNFGWGGLGETNKQQGTNLSRRASRASKAIIASHKLTVVKEKSADDPLTALAVAQLEISNLKNMLKLFLRKSTFLLYSHVFEMSLQRSEDSYRTFGKTIRICYKHKHIFDVSPQERMMLRGQKPLGVISTLNRIESIPKSGNSDSEKNSENSDGSPSKDTFEDLTPTSPFKQRRRSSVSPFPLAAIKEEDEKHIELPLNRWQLSKQDTQTSENYVSETQPDLKIKNIGAFKPKGGVTTKTVIKNVSTDLSSRNAATLAKSTASVRSNILPPNFDTDFDDLQKYKTPVKFVPRKSIEEPQSNLPPIELNKLSQLNIPGVAVKDCYSLKGYQFFLQKGDKVIIKKIYEDNEYLKCNFRNMTGILKKSDLAYTLPIGLPVTLQTTVQSDAKRKQMDEVERILATVKPFSQQVKYQ